MQKPRRSITPIIRVANSNRNFAQVPQHLRPMQFGRYPPDNAVTFERWYMDNWSPSDERGRIYLPIQWTALYCNNGYGNAAILHTIQKYLDGLDTTKKYYTIVQYDDGILNNIDHLDIAVCAMSGPRIDFSLPLLCTPHKFNFPIPAQKKYIASFVGSYTHPIRSTMVELLKDKEGYYLSTRNHGLREYCEVIANSKYLLCPRGYGQSSFRIQEAIDFGAIPVYISDEFVFPYNMPTFPFGIVSRPEEDIAAAIEYVEQEGIDKIVRACIDANRKLFTYAGCKQEILTYLANETTEYAS